MRKELMSAATDGAICSWLCHGTLRMIYNMSHDAVVKLGAKDAVFHVPVRTVGSVRRWRY